MGAWLKADPSVAHAVIVGDSEGQDKLPAIVLDDGEAIPLFGSIGETETFWGRPEISEMTGTRGGLTW